MEYIKLISGIVLLGLFFWILARNGQRSGIVHALGRVDTLVGVICGLYLIFSSMESIL